MPQPQFDPLAGTTKPYAIDPVDLAKKASLNTKKELATSSVPSSSIATTNFDYGAIADRLIKEQQVGKFDRDSTISNLQAFEQENKDTAQKMYTAPRFDYGSVRTYLQDKGKDKGPTIRGMTEEEKGKSSRQEQINGALADYTSRMTGVEADPGVIARSIAGKVTYSDPYQYERDARIVVNSMIKDGEMFDIASEVRKKGEKASEGIQPLGELSLYQKFDKMVDPAREFLMPYANDFTAGIAETESASTYIGEDWKPKYSGKNYMTHIIGNAVGIGIDMLLGGATFRAVGLTQKIGQVGGVAGAITQGLTGSARSAGTVAFITTGILDSGLGMALQGQLVNPNTWAKEGGTFSERYDRFFSDFAMGSVFALGGAGSRYLAGVKDMSRGLTVGERLGVSGLMSGFGYTATKLQGGSDEDALESAILFGMLELAGGVHDTISRNEAKSADQKITGVDLKTLTNRATQELKDMVGGDQKTFQDLMMRYQDVRDMALNAKDGVVPGFFDTPSGKKLFEIYTTPKDKLTKQQIQDSYDLMTKAVSEAKEGVKSDRQMFQEKTVDAKINPNSFFRSPEFKEYYTKGGQADQTKVEGDIVVDQNGAIVSGFGKAKEALDAKARTVDVKQMERIETTEAKVETQDKKVSQEDNLDTTNLETFSGYDDVTVRTLDKIEGKKSVSRQFIENSIREQGMKEQERAIVEEVLKEYEGKKMIPASEFASKVYERLMPLSMKEIDPKWEEYQLGENGYAPGSEEGYVEIIHEAPMETNGSSGHFGDESKYFGHSRIQIRNIDGESFAVVNEVQSDFMQGEKYKKSFLKDEERMKSRIQDLGDKIETKKNFISGYEDQIKSYSKDIQTLKENGDTQYTDTYYKKIEQIKESMERERGNMNAYIAEKYELERDLPMAMEKGKTARESKEFKMIDSYRTTWGDRMIREVVKWAKDKGLKGIMFPDGKTVAFVERWNGGDGVDQNAEVGDTVELYGEQMLILEKGNEDAKVVDERAVVRDLRYQELVDDMIRDEKDRLKEDWEYEKENYTEEFIDKALENESYHNLVKSLKNESDLDNLEMMEKYKEFDINEYEKVRDEVIEGEVERRAEDWNNALNLSEYLNSNYGENTDVYYKSAYGGDREPHIIYLDEGASPQWVDARGNSEDRNKPLEELQADWSDSQKGTSFFYEKIVPKILEKQRKDMYKWTDDNTGLEFYRVDFNENDKPGQPIYAYQKMEQSKKKAEITPEMAREELSRYFTPEEVNVNFVDYISTPDGFKALGRYRNGAIDLVKNPDSSTPTHEALHAYFDMFTAPGRKAELLEQVKTEQGMKDNVQAEEWMADNFVEYIQGKNRDTLTEKVAGFFKDVWEGLKAIFGKEDKIKSFYDDILARKREYLSDKFSVITRYSSEGTKDPLEEISKTVLRPGEQNIGFDTYSEKTARERFDIPKLQQIGKGSDRTVFDLGGGYVLKISQSERGLSQNAQADFFLAEEGIIPQIEEIGRNYVVMERVKTYQEATPEERKILAKFAEEVGGAGQAYRIHKSNANEERLLEALSNWGWDALSNYDIRSVGWGDIRKANLGVKDGKPILLDEGTINLVDFSEKPTGVKESLKDPEFRSIYYDSKRAKSEFGDQDKYTRFQSQEVEVQKMKQRIETLQEEIRRDLEDDPFGDNESFKQKYEEIERIENDILDKVDKEKYMEAQKQGMKEWIKEFSDVMANETEFAQWEGSDKQTKQVVTQQILLPTLRNDPFGQAIRNYAEIRNIGEGELINKIANSDTSHLENLADYILRDQDKIYKLITREMDYPWVKKGEKAKETARKQSKAEDALTILRGQKEKADMQKKMDKLETQREKNARESRREELEKMASYARAKDRMADSATKEDPDLLKIYQEGYDLATKKMNMGVGERIVGAIKGGKERVAEMFAPVWKAGRTLAMPISSRLKQIAPETYHIFKRMEYNVGKKVSNDMATLDDFIKGMKKMQENDMRELSLALLNADTNHAKKVLAKYNIADQFEKVRGVLDQIHKEATEVGIDVGYLDEYFPRMIKNLEGLMGKIEGGDSWTEFYQALKEEAKKKGTTVEELKPEDKAKVLNSMLRGFGDKITLTAPGNLTKARMLDKVTADLGEYYYSPIDSLLRYIQSTHENIEARKFFGKGERVEDSIGSYVAGLVERKAINQEKAKELTKILRTYFGNQKASGDLLGTFRNLTYMMTIANPKSAITNLEDISMTLQEGGVGNAIRAIVNKGGTGIKLKDIGIHELQGELTDRSGSAKALETLFKYSGFQYLDTRMKEAFTEAYYERIKSEAMDPKKQEDLRYEMIKYFPKEEVDQIVKDLQKTGEPTDLVYEALYRKLSAIQPISMGEVPELYLQHSGFKLFYALKIFQLKRWDYYRNEALRDIANTSDKRKIVSAGKRLMTLALYMFITGYSVDTIKNFIFGRPIDPATMSQDQMWKILGVTKYQIYGSRDKGAIETLATSYLTPALFTMTTDIGSMYTVKDDKGNDQVLGWKGDKYIPYLGPMVTWWFGSSGARLDQKAKEAKKKAERDRKKSLTDRLRERKKD